MPGGSAPECAPLPRPSYLAICAHNAVARPERLPAGIAVFHALHFALDICNMPSPLFTGLPAMLQNLPFVKQGGILRAISGCKVAVIHSLDGALSSRLFAANYPCGHSRADGPWYRSTKPTLWFQNTEDAVVPECLVSGKPYRGLVDNRRKRADDLLQPCFMVDASGLAAGEACPLDGRRLHRLSSSQCCFVASLPAKVVNRAPPATCTAEVAGVSVATVKRDWDFARTWLISQLKPEN